MATEKRLLTAKTVKQYEHPDEYVRWLRDVRRKRDGDNSPLRPMADVDGAAQPAVAYVNWGRWVADCPCECGGAELVEPGQPFMCASCFNDACGGAWVPVQWPDEAQQIDRTLMARPNDRQRNWTPAESVADLRHQNRERGLGG